MSRKPETTFYNSVHKYLPPPLYKVKMNNPYSAGLPDFYYSGDKADMWVEYKFIEVPKRPDTLIVPDLSELQLEWCNGRYNEGRNVWVIVGCKDGGVTFNRTEWNEGISAKHFTSWLQSRAALAAWIQSHVLKQEQTCR